MIRRLLSLVAVTAVGLILFYVSRFWDFRLWSNDGLFGVEALRPQGGLLAIWLRGTAFAPFELIIWAIGSVLILTGLQTVLSALTPKERE